jgi:flavin reductase (DIM6/NTAB) family NADH-FMN oxidoreductase RutF
MDINTFSKLTYGVYIVSSGDKDKKNGFVATAVFQVTAIPEKIAIASNKDNYTTPFIQEKKAFSVSVLKQNCAPIIMGNFGFRTGKNFNKFADCNYILGEKTGVPVVLNDAISWFECVVEQEIDLGTHILFVGKVVDCAITSEQEAPLTYQYYHEVKKGIIPKNAPSYVDTNKNKNNINQNQ